MSLFIAEVICSHSFSCKVSQCVCSLWFFVLVLGFFNQLIIIVLCSFDSKQFPEIKKKCCSQTFWMLDCGWLSLNACCGVKGRRRRGEETEIETIYAEDCSPNRNLSSIFYHFNDFLLCQKVVSFPFKWSPEQSGSTLSFTYRSLCKFIHCSSMQQEK